ncbi:helix-turn-helix transcriptional regulator [Hymenobacter sp. GOD-10R]|uniref:helix-turn-helix domain-containing protein n=1 Tax=Hymenobacter sp. GOD-10R TaxID=3093922 RepID=UPI002D7833DA|nr:helix-turn-helix transcriptional regulator [Hymenobacter sp. GOD-10R]WRQ26891.1 helix-turn-helix transcriptional regulator [Hymenobacter sp. GOD-10R]
MATKQPYRFKTITEYCRLANFPKPAHPLISIIDMSAVEPLADYEPISLVADFYIISLKRDFKTKVHYGQQLYDFDEGVLSFMAPNQVFSVEVTAGAERKQAGWMLLLHPDFLWNTPLATKIKQYEYFSYAVHEALHLSDQEEQKVTMVVQHIEQEYRGNMDRFSQDVIIAQLDVLLTYSERFYHRQFLTRRVANHQLLQRLETVLAAYFTSEALPTIGLPTVQYVADQLNVSPNYLSGLLQVLTGQSTQQHIHDKLIEKAKAQLSTTNLSVSEIAYALGFEHAQSFSRLFKTKTSLSPLEFRQSFN